MVRGAGQRRQVRPGMRCRVLSFGRVYRVTAKCEAWAGLKRSYLPLRRRS